MNQTTTKLSHHVRCIARATPYFDSRNCVGDGEKMQIDRAHHTALEESQAGKGYCAGTMHEGSR